MPELVDQHDMTPTRKVLGATAGAAAGVALVWVAGEFGVEMPGAVADAFVVLLTFVGGFFKREQAPTRDDLKAKIERRQP